MLKGKRVGTFTCGISMVLFGSLFLVHMFVPAITYAQIASVWPIVLILLGAETLLSYFANGKNAMKYDFGAAILILLCAMFAVCLAGAQFIMDNYATFVAARL